jgi:hypothetical protein
MVEELFTLSGATDGTSTSGVVSLNSDLFNSAITVFRIPKGLTAKIWFKEVSGEAETKFTLEYSNDITVASPTYKTLEEVKLASKGEISLDKRRPVLLRGTTGLEGFRISFSQPTAALARITLGVELT